MTEIKQLEINYKNKIHHIEFFERKNKKPTILFLHGLGGAKENFEWATKHKELNNHTLVSFDNPGTGNSSYFLEDRVCIDDLVEITNLFINQVIDGEFFLAGASMGGLTLVKYVEKYLNKNLLGLINIEGNLMMEDCMFSGNVIKYDYDTFIKEGYQKGIDQMRENPSCGYQTIASNLELNTNPTAYYDYSFQTVAYSKNGELFESFVNFDLPMLFLHGAKNNTLSYLPSLRKSKVLVKEISGSDHFLFYDNPKLLYAEIAHFVKNNF